MTLQMTSLTLPFSVSQLRLIWLSVTFLLNIPLDLTFSLRIFWKWRDFQSPLCLNKKRLKPPPSGQNVLLFQSEKWSRSSDVKGGQAESYPESLFSSHCLSLYDLRSRTLCAQAVNHVWLFTAQCSVLPRAPLPTVFQARILVVTSSYSRGSSVKDPEPGFFAAALATDSLPLAPLAKPLRGTRIL